MGDFHPVCGRDRIRVAMEAMINSMRGKHWMVARGFYRQIKKMVSKGWWDDCEHQLFD